MERNKFSKNRLFNSKKSQAAMEFLMTYGWAIIIVLAVIAVLIWFGVFNVSSYLGSKIELPSGFETPSSDSYKIYTGGIQISLKNVGQSDVSNLIMYVPGKCTNTTPILLGSSEQKVVKCKGSFEKGQNLKETIYFNYTVDGINHSATGTIISKVEP